MVAKIKSRKVHPWYDFSLVLSYNAVFNFIIGARGYGKTYGMQKRLIKKNIKTGEMFVWMRRYKDEVTTTKNTFFAAVGNEFPDWDFRVTGWLAERAPIETRGEKKREWTPVAYFIPLSIAQSMKGVSFDAVTTIVFDEFIIEKGLIHYLPDEAKAFVNFYSTVDRNQDKTTVFFLANSVTIMNPYFIEYEIRPDQMPKISTMRNGFILVHFPDSSDFKKSVSQTRFGRFISGTEYESYALDSQFADAHNALIETKPSDAKPQFNLETAHGSFSVWYSVKRQEYFIQEKLYKSVHKMFTLVPERMDDTRILVTYNYKPLAYLRTAFRQGSVLFDKPKSRNAFTELFKR